MKKILLISFCVILFLGAIFGANLSIIPNKQICINGTYKSDKDAFMFMTFDKLDDYKFYFCYYSNDDNKHITDIGKYNRESNNTFVINNEKFDHREIQLHDNEFTIIIDGLKHTFKRTSDIPIREKQ